MADLPHMRANAHPAQTPVAIRLENVGKTYRLGEGRRGYDLLSEHIARTLGKVFGRSGRRVVETTPRRIERDSLRAVDGVTLDLLRGEAVGIVGRNGAGKSTLLKLISRISRPTEGRVTVFGGVGTLLEVGTGFHPELTGRENIFLNGALLGMRRREISQRLDEIVEFSGVSKFLDTPVKRYSSGMYVRLAFAIAAHLRSDILLVDEVLAVGDQEFQRKCLGKMQDAAGSGRTVVFVSHNLNAVQRLCDRALLLEHGRVRYQGTPAEVVANYLDLIEPRQSGGNAVMADDFDRRPGSGEARLTRVTMSDLAGNATNTVRLGQPFRIALEFDVYQPLEAAVEIGIWTMDGSRIASALSVDASGPPIQMSQPHSRIWADFDTITFVPGEYYLSVHVRHMRMPPVDYVERALRFTALNVAKDSEDRYRWPVLASVRPRTTWSVDP